MADFYSEIYNQESKERFLDSIDINQYPPRWWERVFEKSFIFEKLKDKDLYSFTVPEILEFYKFLDLSTIAPLVVYNTNLIIYAQWALNENLINDGQNHFDELNNEVLSTCLNKIKIEQSILSYEEFLYILKKCIINEQDRFVFFCVFEGIKGKNYQEIGNIKLTDIDEDNMRVQLCSGRVININQDFINICKDADKQRLYTLMKTEREVELIPSITIYKEQPNSRGVDVGRSIFNTMTRNINYVSELNYAVSAKSIRDSGMIHYLSIRAKQLGITIEELLYDTDNWSDIAEKYQFNVNTKKRWWLQYKDFLQ